jgi:ribose-phosphate pyrophosphokinase
VNNEFIIFSGTANPKLTATIACELGTQVSACVVDQYPDGDVAVQLLDSVRRKEVFLVQPTSPPVNNHLVELLVDDMISTGSTVVESITALLAAGRGPRSW